MKLRIVRKKMSYWPSFLFFHSAGFDSVHLALSPSQAYNDKLYYTALVQDEKKKFCRCLVLFEVNVPESDLQEKRKQILTVCECIQRVKLSEKFYKTGIILDFLLNKLVGYVLGNVGLGLFGARSWTSPGFGLSLCTIVSTRANLI